MYELKVRPHPWFDLFRAVVCGDDPGIGQSKPEPDIFLLAASKLDVSNDQCLIFEDSPAGVSAGKAARMRVIALLSAPVVRSDLVGADVIVSSYDEIDADQLLVSNQ
jgi:pseudouridine-5'-monophosphatase